MRTDHRPVTIGRLNTTTRAFSDPGTGTGRTGTIDPKMPTVTTGPTIPTITTMQRVNIVPKASFSFSSNMKDV